MKQGLYANINAKRKWTMKAKMIKRAEKRK